MFQIDRVQRGAFIVELNVCFGSDNGALGETRRPGATGLESPRSDKSQAEYHSRKLWSLSLGSYQHLAAQGPQVHWMSPARRT
eukprot:1537048-Amphidinium_carterae.1